MKVKLANRQDRKRLSVVLDGEGSGQHSEDVLVDFQLLETLDEIPTEVAEQQAMNLQRDIVPMQLNLDKNFQAQVQVQVPAMQQNLEKTYQVMVPMPQNVDNYQAQAMVPMLQTYQAMVPIQHNMVKNYQPQAMVPMQQNFDEDYQVIIEADLAAPTGSKRIDLRPQGDRNSAEFPFCTTSQTMSVVSRAGPDTEKLSAAMNAYGSMLGQLAKGLVEGAAPQLATMIKAFQVFI